MIYNLNNELIQSGNISAASGSVKQMQNPIDCKTGYKLSATNVGITVEARKMGSLTWINIASTPIDLSADDGQRITYEFRLTMPEVETGDISPGSSALRFLLPIRVAP